MFWLPTFASSDLEREYQAELVPEKIRLTRILAVLAAVLNLAFVALDLWAIPSALAAVWTLRGCMIAGLTATFASTWLDSFPRLYPWIIAGVFLVMASGINGMILIAQPGEAAVDHYYGGLLLVIIGLHTLTYVRPWLAMLLTLAMLGGYAAIAVGAHGYLSGAPRVILLANLFVGVSAGAIGLVAQSLRDRYARENHLLRHSLQRDVELKEEESRRASYLAEHDPLTGLANRLYFEREAQTMIDEATGTDNQVAVMFIDLDGFKPVNDTHGHAVGDRVLRAVAERLRSRLRSEDLCARVGGDEFVVAMTVPARESAAVAVSARRLAGAVAVPVELRGDALKLSASIGVAGFPMDGSDLEAVLRAADQRMYHVKHHGKDGIALPAAWERQVMVEARR